MLILAFLYNIGPASLDFLSVNENELLQQEGSNKIKVYFGIVIYFDVL